jgi:hypothetical protein
MDAIFHLASTPGHPWRDLPAHYGKPDTVARFFRRLDLRSALNGPPWLLPNPLLSEMLARCPPPPLAPTKSAIEAARQHLKGLTWLQKAALGRKSMPRVVRFGWP